MRQKMKYKIFKEKVFEHLGKYKINQLNISENGTFRDRQYNHILPIQKRNGNLLPSVEGIDEKKYHIYAHHLNSSQMMCINFFSLIQNDNQILIDIVRQTLKLPIEDEVSIVCSKFEHTPDGPKHTNFDFFIELSNGMNIYFETKYTENGFGGINPDKDYSDRYKKEWEGFYKKQLRESLHLKEMSDDQFFQNYQINRNIAYIRRESDFVCFIYPFDNETLNNNEYLEGINYKNVYKIDWNDICKIALDVTQGTFLQAHYTHFKEKYLDY